MLSSGKRFKKNSNNKVALEVPAGSAQVVALLVEYFSKALLV